MCSRDNPITVRPDWICEVLSPATGAKDRHVKLPLYARENVPWIWMVDPELRLVEIYETTDGRPTLALSVGPGESAEVPPFGVGMDTTAWWVASAAEPSAPAPGPREP